MSDQTKPIILYGVPFSQPVRSVIWLLLYKRMPFELVLTNPGTKGDSGSRNPAYLAKNPAGTIPMIEEPDTHFVLSEANSIMCYLSNKHGWHDLYPTEAQQRAKIDWYLHFHHRNIREASGLVAPKIRKDLNLPEVMQQSSERTLTKALQAIESGWLVQSVYLAGPQLSLADFAAYAEIGQLQPEFTNVYDLKPFPNIGRWMNQMKQVDGHDLVHTALAELGDISTEPPSLEVIKSANKSALRALKAELEALSS